MDAIVAEQLSKRYSVGSRRNSRKAASLSLELLRRRRPEDAANDVWALRDVSFALSQGSLLGVVGPNGAGKSTLLKLLARVTPPTSGRGIIRGRVVSLLELGAGFQPELTGRENVFMNAAFHGVTRSEVERRMDPIIDFAELNEAIDRPVKTYSSGMYLRLAFSAAVNLEPDVLLADEVLAVGDLAFQERCLRRVQEAGRDTGLTVLFVSHDMSAIRRLCDRTIWIDAGRVAADGATDEVVSKYERAAWARLAGGTDSAQGRHVSEHGEILGGRLLSLDGSPVGAARVSDEMLVESTFRIDSAGVSVRPGVVVSSQGSVAFRSVSPTPVRVDRPGVFSAVVRIPAHLLNDTTYSVKLGLHIHPADGPVIGISHHDALSFRVWDTDEGDSARGDYDRSLQGLVRPRLAWSVEEATRVHDLT